MDCLDCVCMPAPEKGPSHPAEPGFPCLCRRALPSCIPSTSSTGKTHGPQPTHLASADPADRRIFCPALDGHLTHTYTASSRSCLQQILLRISDSDGVTGEVAFVAGRQSKCSQLKRTKAGLCPLLTACGTNDKVMLCREAKKHGFIAASPTWILSGKRAYNYIPSWHDRAAHSSQFLGASSPMAFGRGDSAAHTMIAWMLHISIDMHLRQSATVRSTVILGFPVTPGGVGTGDEVGTGVLTGRLLGLGARVGGGLVVVGATEVAGGARVIGCDWPAATARGICCSSPCKGCDKRGSGSFPHSTAMLHMAASTMNH